MSEHAKRVDELEQISGAVDDPRDDELRDARELAAARRQFADGILALPAACRRVVLEDDPSGPERGCGWPLDKAEACWRRLRELEASDDAALTMRVRRLTVIKRRMERLRDRMVMDNLRLVPHLVRQLGRNHHVPYMDLVQEGNLGLMRAVDRFDPEMGNRFSTYAYWWIRQAVFKALEEKARMIRLPGHVLNSRRALRKLQQEFLEEHGREPTAAEAAERMGVSVRKAKDLLSIVADPQPLEAFGADEDGPSLRDRLAAEGPDALDGMLDNELHERLASALNLLTDREEAIVRLRFGISRGAGHTLREIGEMFSLTRERVRQIERTALAKIGAAEHEVFGRGAAMTA